MKQSFSTFVFSCVMGLWLANVAVGMEFKETPSLKALVEAGKLPPVAQRLPDHPRVIDMSALKLKPGVHGGRLRMLMGKPKDIRMMTVYGYARLIGYTKDLKLEADILESYSVEDGRIFTLHLRSGHKWSDGKPFTTEDFRFYWEDVANHKKLSRGGVPSAMLVDGKPPKFEVIDDTSVRYTWEQPNPNFIPALSGGRPLYIYKPAHYLKQFHPKYQDATKLAELVKSQKVRNWVSLFIRKGRQYRPENPAMPTLQPWRNTTKPPSGQFVFVRNRFYHRVDNLGHQLPYIDEVSLNMGYTKIIAAKTGAGESDLQARYIRFDQYTFLKEGEKRYPYKVKLWRTARGSQVALYPNLNARDPMWRKLMRDVRFRRALSLGIDRHEINQVVYYGLIRESANTVLPQSPLFKLAYQKAWSSFDVAKANKLLDDMGLTKRDSAGIRLMSNGEALEIIVDTAGESTEQTDVLELIRDSWRKIGIKLFSRSSQRDVFRKRIFSGHTVMSVWTGLENGIPVASMSPWELAPTKQYQLQWPMWGKNFESNGKAGQKPEQAEALKLVKLARAWERARTDEERTRIWHDMLKIYTNQVYSIGIVNGSLQPVVIAKRLVNVPERGFYNWDPGAYFGVYMPDVFWFKKSVK